MGTNKHPQKRTQKIPASFHVSQLSSSIPDTVLTESINFESVVRKFVEPDRYVIGFSDLSGFIAARYSQLPYAITLGLRLDDHIIDAIINGPTQAYYEQYLDINRKLSTIAHHIQRLIQSTIYAAIVIEPTIGDHEIDENLRYNQTLSADFSHKMAATRSGLGWIGKSDLFISERFGPRLRLVTILTNHPLPIGTPIEESECGNCTACSSSCPGGAISGHNWNPQKKREDFFDAHKCLKACREITRQRLGVEHSICGICIAVCPTGSSK